MQRSRTNTKQTKTNILNISTTGKDIDLQGIIGTMRSWGCMLTFNKERCNKANETNMYNFRTL